MLFEPSGRLERVAIRRIASLVFGVLLAVSCAGDDVASTGGMQLEGSDRSSSLDPAQPLGPLGIEVDDAVAAGLPFVPLLPRRDGTIIREFIAAPEDPSAAIAAFVYEDEVWGRFVMLQYSDTQTQDGLITEEASQEEGGCSPVPEQGEGAVACSFAPHDVVELGGGTSALVAAGGDTTSLTWVADLHPAPGFTLDDFRPNTGLTIEIQGESSAFTPSNAAAFGEAAVLVGRPVGGA